MAIKKDTVQVRIEIDGQQSLTDLGKLESQAAEIRGELKAGAKAAKEFEAATKALGKADPGTKEYIKAAAAVEKTSAAANKYYADSAKIDKVNAKISELRKEVGLAGLSLRQLSHTQRELSRQIQTQPIGSEKYKQLKTELIEVNGLLSRQKSELRGAANEAAGGGGKLFGILGGAGAALGAAGAAVGIFSAIAGEISSIEKEFNALTKTVQRIAPLTTAQTAAAVAEIQSLSSVFGKESGEILQAANALAKQTGVSFQDSLGLIEAGFIAGADANGEFLDLVKEYPGQFKNAGFSAKEFIQIATQQVRSGIFSDKLLDTVKELDLSLKELTKAQRDALQPLGAAFVDNLAKGLAAGTITTKQAFISIQEQAAKVGLNIQQIQTITTAVFKGAGEDAGGFASIVNNINEALALNLDTLDSLGEIQKAAIENERIYNEALAETARLFDGSTASAGAFFTKVKTAGVEAFNSLFEAIAQSGFLGQKAKLNTLIIDLKARGKEALLADLAAVRDGLAQNAKAQEIADRLEAKGVAPQSKEDKEGRQDRLNALLEKEQFIKAAILEIEKDEAKLAAAAETPEKTKTGGATQQAISPADKEREKEAKKAREKELEESEKQAAKLLADWEALQKQITAIQQENQDFRLDSLGQEQKAINTRFEGLLNEAAAIREAALAQKTLTKEQLAAIDQTYNAKEAAINAAHNEALKLFREDKNKEFLEGKAAVQKQIDEAGFTADQAEIAAVNEKYDTLKEQAIKFGLDAAAIETLRTAELKAIQEKANEETLAQDKALWAARAQVLSQFGDLVGETVNFLGVVGLENSKFQKALTVAQIAINTAASLAGIIPLAVAAAAPTGPAAPFVLAGYIAAMAATVLAGVAGAYKALSKAKDPPPPQVSGGAKVQGFAAGGFTGEGIGIKDGSGKAIAGVVHAKEYVIPERLLRLAPVANMASIIEGMRTGRGFQDGGLTTTAPPIFPDTTPQLLAAIGQLSQSIEALQAGGLRAFILFSDLQNAKQTIDFIEDQTNL